MSENKTVRIGVIGTGSIGRVHMETFGQVPDARVAAVTDVYREGAEKSAADFDIPKVHDNAESLIADDDIDAVVVGVPNRWHAPLAVQACRPGSMCCWKNRWRSIWKMPETFMKPPKTAAAR